MDIYQELAQIKEVLMELAERSTHGPKEPPIAAMHTRQMLAKHFSYGMTMLDTLLVEAKRRQLFQAGEAIGTGKAARYSLAACIRVFEQILSERSA